MEPRSLDELRRMACQALRLDPSALDVVAGWRDGEIETWIDQSDLLPVALAGEAVRRAAQAREHAALPAGERFWRERWWMTDRELRDAVKEACRLAREQDEQQEQNT